MASSLFPQARREGFIVQPMAGELILHDGAVTHLLNATAASVWQLCDGHHSVADISRALALPQETVLYTLQQLEHKQLLLENVSFALLSKPITRREFLKKGALAAAAIPVIKTIQLPGPQQAGSFACFYSPCTTSPECTQFPNGFCFDGCCEYDI